jgi:hypothetical protein
MTYDILLPVKKMPKKCCGSPNLKFFKFLNFAILSFSNLIVQYTVTYNIYSVELYVYKPRRLLYAHNLDFKS